MKKSLFLFLCFSLFSIVAACQKEQKSKTISQLLLENYANLEVNGESQKRLIINEIKKFDDQKITKENVAQLRKILNKMNDGHIFIKAFNKETSYESDLEFVAGSFYVKSCVNSCTPSILEKMLIKKIDGMDFSKWLEAYHDEVFASTFAGRNFRLSRLLQKGNLGDHFQLELQNIKGQTFKTLLKFKNLSVTENSAKPSPCISGQRLKDDLFILTVHEFYCADPNEKNSPFEYYKAQLDEVVKHIKKNDRIILDLRENNGGGDDEVMYFLNHFIKESVFLYEYKVLKSVNRSKKELLKSLITGDFFKEKTRWSSNQVLLTSKKESHQPQFPLIENKLITLISPGCFSSCEGAAEALRRHKRSLLLGTTTHGGQSEPHPYPLKGGEYEIYLPSGVVYKMDKSLYEGIGVHPHIVLEDQFQTQGDDLILKVTDYPFQ